jgi:hypothetical protein
MYLFVIVYVVNSHVTSSISLFPRASNIMKILQNWADYADMNQGVVIYMTVASDVLLICWFGTQLTEQVRKHVV